MNSEIWFKTIRVGHPTKSTPKWDISVHDKTGSGICIWFETDEEFVEFIEELQKHLSDAHEKKAAKCKFEYKLLIRGVSKDDWK